MTTIKTTIICTLQYESWHYWPKAPEPFAYLRNSHRHMFHVRAEISVTGMDREIEFISVKRYLQDFCEATFGNEHDEPLALSCEHMALAIGGRLSDEYPHAPFIRVEVTEDGENGASVTLEIL